MAQSRIAAPVTDPRQTGWPCRGNHSNGRERSNQYARWTSCPKCGLRLTYETKVKGHGETRSLGAAPELVAMAQEELQLVYQANEMNEKIFQGKVMEIKGRQLVMTRGQGSVRTDIRVDEPRGEALLEATVTAATTPGRRSITRSTTTPTTRRSPTTPAPETPRVTRSVSPSPSLARSTTSPAVAKAKAKSMSQPKQQVQEPQTPHWTPATTETVEIFSDGSAEIIGAD